ncbi:hypothetical protein C8A00DRAFT_16792 [Chaetomidium leptoderma]|uniref:Rhodopsin domain-containing protein n=1 Tax=Chaetomidium leptoderma TaxID=669021 RepID=A0AAN6ZTY8_9PEZI|nr:hypothetical protein C8A00DRAFT_16792 [Chaetomidium leptoderma]
METTPPPMFHVSERVAFLSRVHVGTTIPLLALCLVPLFARIYVRIWPVWRFGLDDGFIVAGLFAAIADWALLAQELFFEPQEISYERTFSTVAVAYFAIPVWCLAMTLIKTSIVLTLLRLPLRRTWKVGLYILLAIQLMHWLANLVYTFAKCQPYHAAWDLTVDPRSCPSNEIDIIVSMTASGINIATDLVLSVAPMFIFWNLRRPLRERILICSLTSIGLFATAASIMKVVVVARWAGANDQWESAITLATWTVTEQFVSILAACSPSLKGPIERLLNKLGIPLVEHNEYISFVYMPSRIDEGQLRRQAREWMGDDDTQINTVVSDSTNRTIGRNDTEGLYVGGIKSSSCASPSTLASGPTTLGG